MSSATPCILAMLVALLGLLTAQEPVPKKKPRSPDELYALYQLRSDRWSKLSSNKRETYFRTVFGDWTLEELELVFPQWRFRDLSTHLIRRWASLDPEGAMAQIERQEKKNATMLLRSSRELEGGQGSLVSAELGNQMQIVISSWSKKEPKKVWQMIRDKKGFLKSSTPFRHFASYIAGEAMRGLAQSDSKFAISEIFKQENLLWKERMLTAFCETSPKGQDWLAITGQMLNAPTRRGKFLPIVREDLMGRWMEDDAEAASQWFIANASTLLMIHKTIYSDSGLDRVEKIIPSLGAAVGYWFIRNPEDALAWITMNEAYVENDSVFFAAFLSGASGVGKSRADKGWKVRSKIASLESRKERSRFALKLGLSLFGFDNWPYGRSPDDEFRKPDRADLNFISMEIGKMNLDAASAAQLYRKFKAIAQSPQNE